MAQLFFHFSTMFSGKSLDLIKTFFNYMYQGRKVLVFTSSIDDRNGKIPPEVTKSQITTRFNNADYAKKWIEKNISLFIKEEHDRVDVKDVFKCADDDERIKMIVIDFMEKIGALPTAIDAYLIERVDVYKMAEKEKPYCILVDEVNFTSVEKIMELARIVDELNIPVICYGLKNDSNGNLFPGSEALINHADKIDEQKTICFHCGTRKAKYNIRKEDGRYVFGGAQVAVEKKDEERKVVVEYEVGCRKCYMKIMKEATGKDYVIIPKS